MWFLELPLLVEWQSYDVTGYDNDGICYVTMKIICALMRHACMLVIGMVHIGARWMQIRSVEPLKKVGV